MALSILEQDTLEGKKDDDVLKPLMREICQRLIFMEKLVKNKSMSPDMKAKLEGIKTTISNIKKRDS